MSKKRKYLPTIEDLIDRLSIFQLKLALYARVFFNIFQYNEDLPDNIKKDPSAILRFSESKKTGKQGSQRQSRDSESTVVKFVEQVEHLTFNGRYAAQQGQQVLYITERCVFRLTNLGIELIEIAPGLDLQRDIIDRMAFRPLIAEPLRRSDLRLYRPTPMGISAPQTDR